ncbi:MAG TPA: hypothetical protein VLA52_11430 [Thermohalobaculum sp.]|nr:hypothetical protein [Thermohalobaculum sp.]
MGEVKKEKAHPLLYVIVGLAVINLAATGVLAIKLLRQPPNSISQEQPLPDILDGEIRNSIYKRFSLLFNDSNYEGVFDILHPLARVSLEKDVAIESLSAMHQSFGSVGDGVYSHYDYKGTDSGRKLYSLYFKTRLSGGSLNMNSGTVIIHLFSNGVHYGITGVQMGE